MNKNKKYKKCDNCVCENEINNCFLEKENNLDINNNQSNTTYSFSKEFENFISKEKEDKVFINFDKFQLNKPLNTYNIVEESSFYKNFSVKLVKTNNNDSIEKLNIIDDIYNQKDINNQKLDINIFIHKNFLDENIIKNILDKDNLKKNILKNFLSHYISNKFNIISNSFVLNSIKKKDNLHIFSIKTFREIKNKLQILEFNILIFLNDKNNFQFLKSDINFIKNNIDLLNYDKDNQNNIINDFSLFFNEQHEYLSNFQNSDYKLIKNNPKYRISKLQFNNFFFQLNYVLIEKFILQFNLNIFENLKKHKINKKSLNNINFDALNNKNSSVDHYLSELYQKTNFNHIYILINENNKNNFLSNVVTDAILFFMRQLDSIVFHNNISNLPYNFLFPLSYKLILEKYLSFTFLNYIFFSPLLDQLKYTEYVECLHKRKSNIKTIILDDENLQKEKMFTFRSVNLSQNKNFLVGYEMINNNDKNANTVISFGKGITIDTGGINIKPYSIENMKDDMGGSSSIMANFLSICTDISFSDNLISFAAISANLVNDKSSIPGNIYKTYNGKFVEILNTDAEGRLVMHDTAGYLEDKYSNRFDNIKFIAAATMTGAASRCFGDFCIPYFTSDESTYFQIETSSVESNIITQNLKFSYELVEKITKSSNISDISNISNFRNSGIAAGFSFVFSGFKNIKKVNFTYFDIAGNAFYTSGVSTINNKYINRLSSGKPVYLFSILVYYNL